MRGTADSSACGVLPRPSRDARKRRLLGLWRSPQAFAQQKLDRRDPSTHIGHGDLHALLPPAVALERDPLFLYSSHGRLEQAAADLVQALGGSLGEPRPNSRGIGYDSGMRRWCPGLGLRCHDHRLPTGDDFVATWQTALERLGAVFVHETCVMHAKLGPSATVRVHGRPSLSLAAQRGNSPMRRWLPIEHSPSPSHVRTRARG
jgi:hypothetical protein